jgi:hypothetical protein
VAAGAGERADLLLAGIEALDERAAAGLGLQPCAAAAAQPSAVRPWQLAQSRPQAMPGSGPFLS